MKDKRNEILARQLLEYSTELQKGEVLYLEIKGKETLELGKEVIRLATLKGATTFWYYSDESLMRRLASSPNYVPMIIYSRSARLLPSSELQISG